MDDETIAGIAHWAAYHNQADLLLCALNQMKNIEPDYQMKSDLKHQVQFHGATRFLEELNYHNGETFVNLMAAFDDLQAEWGRQLQSSNLHHIKWLNKRHEIIVEMGLGLLRLGIGFEELECPVVADDIQILPSFDVLEYKKHIKELFNMHRKYRTDNNDDADDIETEDEMIRQSVADLCDILAKPDTSAKPKKNNKTKEEKAKISKVKLRILLEKHSLQHLYEWVNIFLRQVSHAVLPVPILRFDRANFEASGNYSEKLRSPDWTDEQNRNQGPYSVTGRISMGSTRTSLPSAPNRQIQYNNYEPAVETYESSSSSPSSSSAANPPTAQKPSKSARTDPSSPVRTKGKKTGKHDITTPGTLTRAQKDFNIKVSRKDPLPDILSEMVVVPVDSRITRKRKADIAEVEKEKEVPVKRTGKYGVQKTDIIRRSARGKAIPQIEDEEEDEEDEVLTEDQDTNTERNERDEDMAGVDKRYRGKTRSDDPRRDSSQSQPSSHSQQKKQLHELEHYMDHEKHHESFEKHEKHHESSEHQEKQHEKQDKQQGENVSRRSNQSNQSPQREKGGRLMQGGSPVRTKLMDARVSAERVEFDDSEEDIEDGDSDFGGAAGGGAGSSEFINKLKSTAARIPDKKDHPAKLQRARAEQARANRSPKGKAACSPAMKMRRKWSYNEERALEEAVEKHGVSNWAEILQDEMYAGLFNGRTNVNLKDKYRNICKMKGEE